jgi:hypothetical protein
MAAYTVLALALARGGIRTYLALLAAPYFFVWRIYLMIRGVMLGTHRRWVKTERQDRSA